MYFTRSAGAVSVNGIEKVKKLMVRVVVQETVQAQCVLRMLCCRVVR